MPNAAKPRAVVLGGGVAGLRAAIHLLEQGHDVELLEKLAEPGGMARSHAVGGFVFDHGPHGFFARDEWLVDEFKRLVGEDGYHWLTKWSQIHYRSEYFNYPLKIADLARKMSPFTLLAALVSFLRARARVAMTRRRAANAEEYLIDQFGRVLYDEFFGPYTRKVWDVPPRELDADFTRDRVPTLDLWDVIKKLFTDPARDQRRAMLTPSGRIATHDLHTFYYPREGARAIPRGYARRVEALGGTIRTGVDLAQVDRKEKVVRGTAGGEPFEIVYDGMISTIPLDVLCGLLDPLPPNEIAGLASSLRHRAILLVNLCVAKPEVIGPFWIYYTDRFFNRISEYRHFSPDLAPEGKTGICLEVGCNQDDELWCASDEEIVKRCLPDLENLGLLRAEDIEAHLVIREANAYPIYDVGYKARINRLVAWIEHDARIMTAGRQGRFLYINQDAAIKNGLEAARALCTLHETGTVVEREVWDSRPRRKIVS